MPFLRLRDLKSGEAHEFETSTVRIGRDPASELPIAGEAAKVVSTAHLRLVHDGAAWWVEDLSSRNGTYVDARRLTAGSREKLTAGTVLGLGETGPRLKVEAVAGQAMEATMLESPRGEATIGEQPRMARPSAATVRMEGLDDGAPPSSPPPPPPRTLRIVFREARTGEAYEGTGGRLRIGRGQECEVRPVAAGDTAVSRVHAEVVLKPDGNVVVRDARSRNGTFVNGKQLATEYPLKQGDRILLGDGGPELIVERLVAPGAPPQATPKLAAAGIPPAAEARGRRSFGGKGATVFFKEMMAETDRRARGRIRWVVWSFVGLLVLATGGLYLWSETRVRQTARALEAQQAAAQRAADSLRQAALAEYQHLRIALDSARGSSAPAAVVESLRTALTQASSRTAALEASLQRAQASLNQQLAAGDSLRRLAQTDLQRLRGELNRASGDQVSSALLDSLRRALRGAEERANSIDQQLRAVKGVDLAAISQANQSAVGLVTAFVGTEAWDGSGFVITRSGYFLTNRHVATPDGRAADSVTITLADQQVARRVAVVAVAPSSGPDLAVLKIPNYAGPYIAKADWTGTRARQGEPAALIGFPTGAGLAYDRTRTVRTSMSAGIFSKVTEDRIQFDGFTVGGSSGSPIFNANGEVVAVHAAGLREAAGLGLTVPIRLVIPLLPPDAKAELGIS
ncbi:MAG TPA: FHA domain-containing protein [Gemmatimonadales bacterium]|jgi:pSer/pThr/pTyr-binding forkhead associated (FHA) protein/S1-C subfamily serine protease|nr:FHA domain-containing protein [Gemmatimonadales bacterium]